MKKAAICLLACALLLSFTGCFSGEKLAEKFVEKVVEGAGGGDLDIDGDVITIKGDDGETLTFGGGKWPTSALASTIPEFKDGTVTSVMEGNDSTVIALESVLEKNALAYFQTIKKQFPKDVVEMNSQDSITFSGNNESGINVVLMYMEQTLTIMVNKIS